VAKATGNGHFTGVTAWLTYWANAIVTAMVAVSFGSYASYAVADNADWADPPLVALDPPVVYPAEIMITSVRVVDDPCRTTWTGSCAGGGTQGIWTFGELMRVTPTESRRP